jgi:uncharacterized membrane protein
MIRDLARRSLVAAELTWTASLLAAVYLATHAAAGTLAHAAAALEYSAASLLCHQRPERSFFLWGMPLPVCARCVGIYAGAAGTAAVRLRRRFARPALVVGLACTPALLSILYEWTSGVTPSNAVRAATGAIAGAAIMAVLLQELRGE